MAINWESWPVLDQASRPKKLYYCSEMAEEWSTALKEAGWIPIDIRTLPERDDDEKIEAIKAYLQGIRLGSIAAPTRGYFSELEARVYGLLSNKRPEKTKEPMNPEDLESILGPLAKKAK